MGRTLETESLTIPGPSGALEALWEAPRGKEPGGAAVICHPHPLHGGTMQNKVVHTLARAFVGCGFAALRFNFRGVGKSEGTYDQGAGETTDAVAAMTWMKERFSGNGTWLAGFSFGAAVAIRAAAEVEPAGLVTVAPPTSRLAGAEQPSCRWLVVQGAADEVVDTEETLAWLNDLEPGPELRILDDASHFFHGRLVELRRVVEAFVRGE